MKVYKLLWAGTGDEEIFISRPAAMAYVRSEYKDWLLAYPKKIGIKQFMKENDLYIIPIKVRE